MLAEDSRALEQDELGHPCTLDARQMGDVLAEHRPVDPAGKNFEAQSRVAFRRCSFLLGAAWSSLLWLVGIEKNAAPNCCRSSRVRHPANPSSYSIRNE